jgi:hypothetical protein
VKGLLFLLEELVGFLVLLDVEVGGGVFHLEVGRA